MKKSISFLVFIMMVFGSLYAQTYQDGKTIDKSFEMFWCKQSFAQAGDKYLQLNLDSDSMGMPTLNAVLYNADFSVFKSFTYSAPGLYPEIFHGDAAKCFEIVDGEDAAYFLAIQTELEENDSYLKRVLVFNEENELLANPETSWLGFHVFEHEDAFKLVCYAPSFDTVYYGGGWGVESIYTSTITDMLTGELEFTFPRDTRFVGLAEIGGKTRVITNNNIFSRYGADSSDCFKSTIYNMDYSVYKTIDKNFNFDSAPISYGFLYNLIAGGKKTYFHHSMTYLMNEDSAIYSTKNYLVDEDGQLLKISESNLEVVRAVYLPGMGKDYILSRDTLYSIPELNPVTRCNFIIEKNSGEIKLGYTHNNQIVILNDDLSTYETIGYDPAWILVDAGYDIVAKNNKIAFVCTKKDWSNGILVFNEDEETVIDIPDFRFVSERANVFEIPMILFANNEKYARIVSQNTAVNPEDGSYNTSHFRTGELSVSTTINNVAADIPVELYKVHDGEVLLEDTRNSVDGAVTFLLGEGGYYLKAIGEENNALNTYYSDALIWEEATRVVFTTDHTDIFEIDLEALPVSTEYDGVISGNIIESRTKTMGKSGKNSLIYDLFLVNKDTRQTVGMVKSSADGGYQFENVEPGNYIILVDIPGMPLIAVNEVMLANDGDIVENINYTITDDGVYGSSPSSIKNSQREEWYLYPNPATEHVHIAGLSGSAEIKMFDVNGRLVLETSVYRGIIDISRLNPGIYLIRIEKEGNSMFGKVIKR